MSDAFIASAEEAEQIIWWLVKLLGGRVTIPTEKNFWDANLPDDFRVGVDHDGEGNPVLVAEQLDWTQAS
jgi:hypothetical protein